MPTSASANGFAEDAFVGKRLRIGERAVIAVLDRDPRCKMISLDPDTGEENSERAAPRGEGARHQGRRLLRRADRGHRAARGSDRPVGLSAGHAGIDFANARQRPDDVTLPASWLGWLSQRAEVEAKAGLALQARWSRRRRHRTSARPRWHWAIPERQDHHAVCRKRPATFGIACRRCAGSRCIHTAVSMMRSNCALRATRLARSGRLSSSHSI